MSALRYRPEIDGLRAIAVLVVMIDHARFKLDGVPFLTGGYLGVDVFFVISGYLITLILLKGLAGGGPLLLNFWERRIRRIIPALSLVLIATLCAGWFILLPDEQTALGNSALATLAFVSNIWFWTQTDYWAPASLTTPLLHTWSLAVEEQFYLLFPLLLLALFRWRQAAIPWVLAGIVVLSLGWAETTIDRAPEAAFYLLHTRAWELACGALLAWFEFRHGRRVPGPLARLGPFLGLVLLVPSFLLFDAFTRHPSLWTAIPIMGACLLVWCAGQGCVVSAVLSSRPFVAVGKISYGLYLWHYPIYAYGRLLDPDPSVGDRLVWIGLAFLLATGSYFLIEKPARRPDRVRLKPLLGTVVSAGVLIGSLALTLRVVGEANTLPDYWDPESGNRERFMTHAECWIDQSVPGFAACREQERSQGGIASEPEPGRGVVLVVGDSHVAGVIPGLIERYGRSRVKQRIGSGCFTSDACGEALEEVRSLDVTEEVALVIVGGHLGLPGNIERVTAYATSLAGQGGPPVVVLGVLPQWPQWLPAMLMRGEHRGEIEGPAPTWLTPDPVTFELEQQARDVASSRGLGYLSVVETLCEPPLCLARIDDSDTGMTSFDAAHLTHTASRVVVDGHGALIDRALGEPARQDSGPE